MEYRGDYHIHSTYSDGRGTVQEMVAAASRSGLKEIGLADHGPRNIGTGVRGEQVFLQIKEEIKGLSDLYPGLKIYTGAEADVINPDGTLDLSKEVIKELDYLLVGLHPYVLPQGINGWRWVLANQASYSMSVLRRRAVNRNTKALVEALFRYDVWFITHPGLKMEIDIPEVARACLNRDVAWEINTGHKYPSYADVLKAARCSVDFIVCSDAHYPETVGRLEYGSWVLEKAGVPCERVRNALLL